MKKLTGAVIFGGAFLLGNYLTGFPIWKSIFKKVGING